MKLGNPTPLPFSPGASARRTHPIRRLLSSKCRGASFPRIFLAGAAAILVFSGRLPAQEPSESATPSGDPASSKPETPTEQETTPKVASEESAALPATTVTGAPEPEPAPRPTTGFFDLNTTWEAVRGDFDGGGGDLPLLPADQLRIDARFHRESLGALENPELRLAVRAAREKEAAGTLEPFSQFDRNPNFGAASTDGYAVLDLGLGFDWRDTRVDFEITNLPEEDYRDFLDTYKGYALNPGRSAIIQVSHEF